MNLQRNLITDFSNKKFKNEDFSNTKFNASDFTETTLDNVDLSNSELNNCEFTFTECKNVNFNFCKGEMCDFKECKFVNCSFQNLKFSRCNFDKCIFDSCDLSRIEISTSNISETKMNNVDMDYVNFEFLEIDNSSIELKNSSMKSSMFINCNLQNLEFSNSNNMTECVFQGTTLFSAIMSDSDYIDCAFESCNIDTTLFKNSNFKSTAFENNKMIVLNFENCRFDDSSIENCYMLECNMKNCYMLDSMIDSSELYEINMESNKNWEDVDFSDSQFINVRISDKHKEKFIDEDVTFRTFNLIYRNFLGLKAYKLKTLPEINTTLPISDDKLTIDNNTKCFEPVMGEENVLEFLNDEKAILFAVLNENGDLSEYICSDLETIRDQYLKDYNSWFYQCKGDLNEKGDIEYSEGGDLINVMDEPYVKIPARYQIVVKLSELMYIYRELINPESNSKLYILYPSEKFTHTINYALAYNKMPEDVDDISDAIIGGKHCQKGSNMTTYKIYKSKN